jgi:hypothetical protein
MIKAAAIKVGDKVYTGFRHAHIIIDNKFEVIITQEMQGFVTDDDKFINREEAAKIAYECGQINKPKRELFSEDIF